jgi:hypothetical protein
MSGCRSVLRCAWQVRGFKRLGEMEEEATSHQCKPQPGGVSEVIDLKCEWWISSDLPRYGSVLIVKTTDGKLYRITFPNRNSPSNHPETEQNRKSPRPCPHP